MHADKKTTDQSPNAALRSFHLRPSAFICGFILLAVLVAGCTLRWHTGPAPIVVDHGDHVEVVP